MEFIQAFGEADLDGLVPVHDLDDELEIFLWILYVGRHRLAEPVKEMTAAQIHEILLEVYDTFHHRNQISHRLGAKSATNYVHINVDGRRSQYRLLKTGMDLVEGLMRDKVLFINPNDAYKGLREFHAVLGGLKGELLVCDTHIESKTLDQLSACISAGSVRLLTQKVHNLGLFKASLAAFSKEIPIEVRKVKQLVLHDRYIITDDTVLIMGASLNGVGKKQSFVVELGEDIREAMVKFFETEWQNATNVI